MEGDKPNIFQSAFPTFSVGLQRQPSPFLSLESKIRIGLNPVLRQTFPTLNKPSLELQFQEERFNRTPSFEETWNPYTHIARLEPTLGSAFSVYTSNGTMSPLEITRKRNQREFEPLLNEEEIPKRPKVDADLVLPSYTPDTPSLHTARKILDILKRRKQASTERLEQNRLVNFLDPRLDALENNEDLIGMTRDYASAIANSAANNTNDWNDATCERLLYDASTDSNPQQPAQSQNTHISLSSSEEEDLAKRPVPSFLSLPSFPSFAAFRYAEDEDVDELDDEIFNKYSARQPAQFQPRPHLHETIDFSKYRDSDESSSSREQDDSSLSPSPKSLRSESKSSTSSSSSARSSSLSSEGEGWDSEVDSNGDRDFDEELDEFEAEMLRFASGQEDDGNRSEQEDSNGY